MDYRVPLWLVELLPLLILWYMARNKEVGKEQWAVAAVFAVSFLAVGVQRWLLLRGLPTWIVPVIYPVPQIAVLAYGFSARWPKLATAGTLFSVSVTGVGALVVAFTGLPIVPEMRTLAVASVIALWFAWARPDLGVLRWSIFLAFGATLPAVIAMRPLFDRGFHSWWMAAYHIPFTAGVLLGCWAIWSGYREPAEDLPPPPGLEVLRSWMLTATGRA